MGSAWMAVARGGYSDAWRRVLPLRRHEASGVLVWRKEAVMPVESCIPIIPSANLEKSLRLWVDGLGFSTSSEMRKDDKLIFCMLRKDELCFMLNQRAGTPVKPEDYEGIRL